MTSRQQREATMASTVSWGALIGATQLALLLIWPLSSPSLSLSDLPVFALGAVLGGSIGAIIGTALWWTRPRQPLTVRKWVFTRAAVGAGMAFSIFIVAITIWGSLYGGDVNRPSAPGHVSHGALFNTLLAIAVFGAPALLFGGVLGAGVGLITGGQPLGREEGCAAELQLRRSETESVADGESTPPTG